MADPNKQAAYEQHVKTLEEEPWRKKAERYGLMDPEDPLGHLPGRQQEIEAETEMRRAQSLHEVPKEPTYPELRRQAAREAVQMSGSDKQFLRFTTGLMKRAGAQGGPVRMDQLSYDELVAMDSLTPEQLQRLKDKGLLKEGD